MRVFFTPIRVVCANTLGMAERRSHGSGVSIVHKGDLAAKVREAQEILGFAKRFYDDLGERINRLASHQPSRRQLETYYELLYPDRANGKNHRAANIRSKLFELFENGIGQDMPAIRHTSWAAFNAVTEFVDHHRSTRGRTDFDRRRPPSRIRLVWLGFATQVEGLDARARNGRLIRSSFIGRFLAVAEIVRVSEKLPCKGPPHQPLRISTAAVSTTH